MKKSLNQLKEAYKLDLELHSNIKPLEGVINYDFEKEIEKNIVKYLRDKAKYKGFRTLYAGFINRKFDTVLLEEMNDSMLILTALNMDTQKVTCTYLEREVDNKEFIKYTKTRITTLPDWLQNIIKKRNSLKNIYHLVNTHRLTLTQIFDLNGLVVHHIEYFNSEDSSDKRKCVIDSIDYLLPMTEDFHDKFMHNINHELMTEKDKQNLIERGYELKKVLNEYIEPKKNWNAPSVDSIKRVLTKHLKENISINELAEDYNNPSKNTIIKIIKKYQNFVNFL